ncbi:MAG: 30S ribosomal protein S12 methylthiotransferase RimO [Oscillospiraceae bacterium]|nr:30S ribosomal protein S12 methylthiotransferase RimO [Oscillospiraceae bacterium]
MSKEIKVAFLSLGCAKNLVNTEQMMALCRDAGLTLADAPEGADVAVINTCGFIDSAKEEAIDNILAMGELKKRGRLKKILVTGCLSQRYKDEITESMPEVDGLLGTGSYSEIVSAVNEVLADEKPRRFGNIHAPVEELDRVITTPSYTAYLRIAEGCDNHCAFCVIPSLRGKYRSRRWENVLAEAKKLSGMGVKEVIVIAQDITRYGTDNYGKRRLPELIHELCKLDFHWVRLHYLYPDEFDDELIDAIASEPKVLKYLDIPIQHCNDKILRAMNRRGNKEYLTKLFAGLRGRIPGLVLRTSIITGLPYEGEAEFDELCDFLREVRIERAGVFPYSPEDGTPAARMEHVDEEEARRRAELLVDVQSRIMDEYNESMLGEVVEVLCEGFDAASMGYIGRSYAESVDIDGKIYFSSERDLSAGEFVNVRVTGAMDGELTGEAVETGE